MAIDEEHAEQSPRSELSPGTEVEVQSGFDETWQRGFTVETVAADGYVLRRQSDGTLLPEIARHRVRRPRRRQTWWI
jgi:hypothetical protein